MREVFLQRGIVFDFGKTDRARFLLTYQISPICFLEHS